MGLLPVPPARIDGGSILFDGRDLVGLKEPILTRFRRDKVGVVFQSFNLLPLLTLAENAERLRQGRICIVYDRLP